MSESEREVVGIRGLDPNLYNQILAKAREMGKNVSELMNEALRRYLEQVLAVPVAAPAVFGEGFVDLRFSRSDLEKLGKAIIRDAVNVKFAEDVDDKAIEEHIVAVENCVDVRVPQQAYISLMKRARNCISVRSYTEKPPTVSQSPQREEVEPTRNAEVVRIGDLEELELSKEDLESFGKKVVLQGIEHLKLGPDVDAETVGRYIEAVHEVNELEVPRSIYMVILTRQRGCETITKY